MEREGGLSRKSDGGADDKMRPFLRGCLTGGLNALLIEVINGVKPSLKMMHKRDVRFNLVYGATSATVSLGLFEILTKKIRTTFNDGEPLSLYKEAVCGLTCGATATFVSQPFMTMLSHATEHGLRKMSTTLSHLVRQKGVLALWKGAGSFACIQMAAYMVMLPSYYRTLNYLTDSKGLSKWTAQLSAGVVSGFLAGACSYPVLCCGTVIEGGGGIKNVVYRNIPRDVLSLLSCRKLFHSVFLNYFRQRALFCMAQWFIYERIRDAEEFMDQGTHTLTPEMEREGGRSDGGADGIMKPLVRGFLTGGLQSLLLSGHLFIKIHTADFFYGVNAAADLKKTYKQHMLYLKRAPLFGATNQTATLGLFEILTKKLRTEFNDGEPLPLYQETVCGMICGATASLVSRPMTFHSNEIDLLTNLRHIVRHGGLLGLWRGSGSNVCTHMATYMGMLPAYNRSLNYFTETKGLPKWKAEISASIVSGFFAAASTFSVTCIRAAMESGALKELNHKEIPLFALQYLCRQKTLAMLLRHFRGWTPVCMVQWFIYERIREAQDFMDQGKSTTSPTVAHLGND